MVKKTIILRRARSQEETNNPVFFWDSTGNYIVSVVGQEGDMRMRISTPKGRKEIALVGATPEGMRRNIGQTKRTANRNLRMMGVNAKVV